MSVAPEPLAAQYMVMAAWQCAPCDVEGRSLIEAAVECWNCGGDVTVTAQPSILIDDPEQFAGRVPIQRLAAG